jgi:N-acyl-D-aspartate/D-glutamate deacylase
MDLIIRGGTVFDGTLAEGREADVAIKDGVVVRIGQVPDKGAEEIDARGKIVTPGFVDIHTHYDGQAIWSDRLSPSSSHGVTSVVLGNCGVGFAPCRPEDRALMISVCEGVEDIPGAVMAEGLSWEWETFPEYLDALERRPRDIDVATLFPHMPLRVYAMGKRGADREPATAEDLARMYAITREAISLGALGLATSLLFTMRTRDGDPIPTFGVSEEELLTLGRAVRDGGGGVFQTPLSLVPSSPVEDELALLDRVVRLMGGNAMFSLGQIGDPLGWRKQLDIAAALNRKGGSVKAQVYPRGFGLLLSFDLTVNPWCLCPSYISIAQLPLDEKLKHLRNPEFRAKLMAEEPTDNRMPFWLMGRQFERIFPLGDPPNYEPSADSCIAAQAKAQGRDPLDLAYDLLLERDGQAMLFLPFANYVENSLDYVPGMIRDPNAIIGLGDGGAHYGMVCDSTYTTFLLSYWTRDRKGERISLPQAISKIARETAAAIGLNDRGVLVEGGKADINVIDYDKLQLSAPWVSHDLPAGGKRVTQSARGYTATIVSGEIVLRDDQDTGNRPGKLVRKRRSQAAT